MRLVSVQKGVLHIQWQWLPCWLALNPLTKDVVAQELMDRVLLGGVTTSEEDLDAMSQWVKERFCALFPAFDGLGDYLEALRHVRQAEEPSEAA